MKIKDTILCVLSDMHTGGSTALFPAHGFSGDGNEDNHVLPNDRQKEMYSTWVRMAGEVKQARKDKRLIVVNLGDAIDGSHHNSIQESLFRIKDQCTAHVELMQEFMRRVGYNKKSGDELYYVQGTEVHVGETENDMAKELGAIKGESGRYVSDILELNINGLNNLFAHHGKGRGEGTNEGNSLRNALRNLRDDREKDGLSVVDVSWSGHTHGHIYENHIKRTPGGNYHILHGIICPSWQAKTRFALGKVPRAVNSIGGVYARIGVDGSFGLPRFVVKVTKDK